MGKHMKKTLFALLISVALLLTGCGDDVSALSGHDAASVRPENETVSENDVSSLPEQDVSASLDYYPNAFEAVPEEVRKEFSEYVHDHLTLMGTLMFNSCLADVTGDGYDDICSSFYTGSGIVTSLIIVYDVQEKQGYKLDDRMVYDYMIEGVEDGRLVVERRKYCSDDESLMGTVVCQDGGLYFDDGIDTMGVPYKVINLFGDCAAFLQEGNTSSGDYLSSMDFDYVREFMFYLDADHRETVHGISADQGYSTYLMKIPYDEWAYLIEEVYMEEDISRLLDNLDPSYEGDSAVYYDQADDCIYLEGSHVTIGDQLFIMRSVSRSGDEYVITYDVYSGWQLTPEVYDRTVRVTIEKADNTYGYHLLSVKI